MPLLKEEDVIPEQERLSVEPIDYDDVSINEEHSARTPCKREKQTGLDKTNR